MAVIVVATPKASNANSYATVAEGTSYHEGHPYPTVWEDASEDEQARALVTATRMLDTWYEWNGIVSTLTQSLAWPRRGVIKDNITQGVTGTALNEWHEPYAVLLDPDVIPARIRDATCELARLLLASDRTADSELEVQGIKSLKAGPVELTFQGASAKPIPDSVAIMVAPYGRKRSASGGAVSLGRG